MILNLTQHAATPAQIDAGVVDLVDPELATLKGLLTFEEIPTQREIWRRAVDIARLAQDSRHVEAMIGGALFLMGTLERALKGHGITPMFAFTRWRAVDTAKPDGTVVKTAVFEHAGFVCMDDRP